MSSLTHHPARTAVARSLAAVALLLVTLTMIGCGQTERTITVTSEPPGALVYANGVEMGRTPVTFPFLWYGDYDFVLAKDGYETLKTHRPVRAPVSQWVGVDLLTEVFWPATIRDDKQFHFDLSPMPPVNRDALYQRAKQFQDETLHQQ